MRRAPDVMSAASGGKQNSPGVSTAGSATSKWLPSIFQTETFELRELAVLLNSA